MLWYGLKSKTSNFKVVHKRKNLNVNLRTKKLSWKLPRRRTLTLGQSSFSVPDNWLTIVLASNNSYVRNILVYLYNDLYYFKVALPGPALTWSFDRSTNVFNQKTTHTYNFLSFYKACLNSLCQSFLSPFFCKLKIQGKGYYIYKNFRNTVTHQLGHSHRTYIYSYFLTVKFLSKKVILLFGLSKRDVFSIGFRIRASKYINIFTGRGVRFSRQIVYKKTGKVSAYR